MIIADLIDHESKEGIGRVYLSGPPFPGDTIERPGDPAAPVMVIRRAFLDLGPDADPRTLSLKLNVRAVR